MSISKQIHDQVEDDSAPFWMVPDDTEEVSNRVLQEAPRQDRSAKRRHGHVPKSEAGKILRDIRKTLGVSMMEMASILNLQYVTYCSYEYGKVLHVSEGILNRAQELLVADRDRLKALEPFAGRTMQQIVKDWYLRMDIPFGNITEFANQIGLNKSTVSRWLSGEIRPQPQQILRYEAIVTNVERLLNNARARVQEKQAGS